MATHNKYDQNKRPSGDAPTDPEATTPLPAHSDGAYSGPSAGPSHVDPKSTTIPAGTSLGVTRTDTSAAGQFQTAPDDPTGASSLTLRPLTTEVDTTGMTPRTEGGIPRVVAELHPDHVWVDLWLEGNTFERVSLHNRDFGRRINYGGQNWEHVSDHADGTWQFRVS